MFCQNCGNEIKEEELFCRLCGEQISGIKISFLKKDWVKRVSAFSLEVIAAFGFILSIFFLMYKLNFKDSWAILLLFIMTLFSCGIINVLLKDLKEMKKKSEKESADKEIKFFPKQRKQLEEKTFIPLSWSVTETTTENLFSTQKRITDEL